jgi:hypothetical protein
MKEIRLPNNMVAIVDDEDYEHFNQWKWHAQKNGSTYYAVRTKWLTKKKGTTVRMHREIMAANGSVVVDHIDHNGLNNQKNNLRLCTKSENGGNRLKRMARSSKYLGVHFCNTRKLWVAQIQHQNKAYSAGIHKTEIDAAIAYNIKAKLLHGDFARLNQIQ